MHRKWGVTALACWPLSWHPNEVWGSSQKGVSGWHVECTGGQRQHTYTHTIPSPSLSPLKSSPSSLFLVLPICPEPLNCTQWDGGCLGAHAPDAGRFPCDKAECEAIRHLGTTGPRLETHSEQVSSRHECCLTLGELGCSGAAPSIYLALMVFAPQIKWCLSDS